MSTPTLRSALPLYAALESHDVFGFGESYDTTTKVNICKRAPSEVLISKSVSVQSAHSATINHGKALLT